MTFSLIKDTIREIKGSFGRFFSILMIVAIGCAFFAGVKASVPDMKYTADQYFDDYNLMDIRIVSTMGLSNDDVDSIRAVEGVEGVFPTMTKDVLTHVGTSQLVIKVHALPIDDLSEENKDYINRPKLLEGRLPMKSGECVIEQGEIHNLDLEVGDRIQLESGTETALSEDMKTSDYTIVGIVQTPYYLSYEKGSTSIGSGKIDYFIMIPQEDFTSDIYTEVNVTVAGARAYNSYQDDYFEVTDKVKDAIESIGVERADIRYEEILTEANEKLEEGKEEYEEGKLTFETKIKESEASLASAKAELDSGQAELEKQKSASAETIANGKAQLASAKEQLETARKSYQAGLQNFEGSKVQLEEQITKLNEQIRAATAEITSIEAEIKKITEQMKDPALTESERSLLGEKLAALERTKAINEQTIATIEPSRLQLQAQLNAAENKLKESEALISSSEAEIAAKETELAAGETTAQEEFNKAEEKLRTGKEQYESGLLDLEKAKKSGQEELDLAKEKLDKAELDIKEISEPEWYVLDRKSHYSYMDYGSVADRMDGIAKVFPLFFFLVAALVCLTTMTRMVDEQRSTIGTLKALGYRKNAIAFKYIAYAFIASIFGSILGCSLGMYIFPTIIFNAWNLMYTMPPIQYVSQLPLAIGASSIVIGITVLAAYFAVYKELIETPALLMRPKAPRAGKKILLERMTFLWKHFSFTEKVTARNLFRYKKRFFMTVIGISGCTALLVAGFGIQDSIAQVVDRQYGGVFKFDIMMNYAPDTTLQEKADTLSWLGEDERITDSIAITSESANVLVDKEEEAVTIMSPSDSEKFKDFVSLHKRGSEDEIDLPTDGVLISEKLSMNADVRIGDTLEIDNGDGIKRKITIKGIVENYVGHYIYMSPSYYQQIFHINQENTTILSFMVEPGTTMESALGQEIIDHKTINSVSFYSGVASSFSDMISSLDFIIVVLVIAAGMLAFVVLYNLTNVNISERLREIATIKVLGFYDLEVAEYVYRENIFLTLIGALCGLVLGIGLHQLIMNLAEMESVMFGRNIDTSSFLFSMMITMLFAIIVNLVMYRKLKKIPMVESLKSIE